MLKRWTKFLLKLLLALFVLLFLFLLFERVRGQISLAHYKRELIAKGEKLTFLELIPPVPPGENGAPELFAAIEQLKKGTVLPGNYPPMMQLTPAGHAVVGFRESEWIDDKKTNHWDQLAADLKTNEATLAKIRLASLPPDKKGPRNLWNRRDFVWPSPALPEEIEAYRKEAAKK